MRGERIGGEESNDSLIREKGGITQKKGKKRSIHIVQEEAEDKEGSAKIYR